MLGGWWTGRGHPSSASFPTHHFLGLFFIKSFVINQQTSIFLNFVSWSSKLSNPRQESEKLPLIASLSEVQVTTWDLGLASELGTAFRG